MKLSFVPSASPDVLQLLTKHRSSWTPCGVFQPPLTATIVIEDLRVALGLRGFHTDGSRAVAARFARRGEPVHRRHPNQTFCDGHHRPCTRGRLGNRTALSFTDREPAC